MNERYFAVPLAGVDALAFNSSRPPFFRPNCRRAAALALDRSAATGSTLIVNERGVHASQRYRPPPCSAKPNLATALPTPTRSPPPTSPRRRPSSVGADLPRRWPSPPTAMPAGSGAAVRSQLAAIGITVDITTVNASPSRASPTRRLASTWSNIHRRRLRRPCRVPHHAGRPRQPHCGCHPSFDPTSPAFVLWSAEDRLAAAVILAADLSQPRSRRPPSPIRWSGQSPRPCFGCRILPPSATASTSPRSA